MGKSIDTLTVKFALFLFFTVWLDYLTGNLLAAAAISSLLTAIIIVIAQKLREKRSTHNCGKDEFYKHLALNGSNYTLTLYLRATGVAGKPDGGFFADTSTLYASYFNFVQLSMDNVAVAYRKARENDLNKIQILCLKASRELLLFASTLPVEITIITAPDIYRAVREANALPEIPQSRKPHMKYSFKELFFSIFSPASTRYFMFSGVLLSFISFVTPFRLYYVVLSTLSLIAALITAYPRRD